MNTPPHHLTEQMSTYVDCMSEACMRFERADDLSARCLSQGVVTELDIEFISLQARKIIELIALASIAAIKTEYEKIRTEFAKDWNARLIFRDIERVNPNFFPVPFEIIGPKHMAKPTYPCLDKEGTLDFYIAVGAFLHSRNRYARIPNYGQVLEKFAADLALFGNLLRGFEAHVLPEEYMYLVTMNFGAANPVHIALAGYIHDD